MDRFIRYKIGDVVKIRDISFKPKISNKVAIIVDYPVLQSSYDYVIIVCGQPQEKHKIFHAAVGELL